MDWCFGWFVLTIGSEATVGLSLVVTSSGDLPFPNYHLMVLRSRIYNLLARIRVSVVISLLSEFLLAVSPLRIDGETPSVVSDLNSPDLTRRLNQSRIVAVIFLIIASKLASSFVQPGSIYSLQGLEPYGGPSLQSLVARVDFNTHRFQGGDTQQRFGIRLAE